jgi:hypothetical protein
MLYNIGINQKAVIDHKWDTLDFQHLCVFDAMHKIFTTFTKIQKLTDEEGEWYWLNYDLLLEQLPLLRIKSKNRLRDLIKELEKYSLINFNSNNQKLGRTYFRLGENAQCLISDRPIQNNGYLYTKVETPLHESGDNNNHNITTTSSEIGVADFSDGKNQVQSLNQKSIQSNTQKKEKEPSGFSDQCMAAQPADELQAFQPAEMWRQKIEMTCPDMDQLAVEIELLNFKTHYSTKLIPENLDKSFQQWCQRSNNTYFKIKKERERIEQYDVAKRENIKKVGTNSHSYSKYSKSQIPVDANLKVDYNYCEDNWTNPLLTPKTV